MAVLTSKDEQHQRQGERRTASRFGNAHVYFIIVTGFCKRAEKIGALRRSYFLFWEGQHTGCMSNPSKYAVPQSHMTFSTGIILFPKAVSE